jgi:aldehyde:ferredoxin oxidoreductase
MRGYAGKILRVKLSDGRISKEEMRRRFLGGRP